jgi:hypothetical protein
MGSEGQSSTLETVEHVLDALRTLDDRDHAIDALIADITRDRERLLGSSSQSEALAR